ncbi:MFS transporter [Citrobacter sp. MNAZ 1397]|uniref:MFS transporter n=1 Tax=Citrobacter sp. MNAZ 1397 TaxID=2911205 RepID=UPI0032EFE35E
MDKTISPLALTGFLLIAVTYGMARFAWGLMLPSVGQDIALSPRAAGVIAACSYIAYCFSSLWAAPVTGRYGARTTAIVSALCAALGLLILALSSGVLLLALGLFIAGLSSGLASPSLAASVSQAVAERRQSTTNTFINAGTGGGIILSVPVLLFTPFGWRGACIAFAVLALLCLLPVMRYLPATKTQGAKNEQSWRQVLQCQAMRRLALIAFICGIASAAWWNFGPDILQNHLHIAKETTSMLWLVSGGAGIAGIFTGALAARTGWNPVYWLSLLFMAAPLVLLAVSHGYSGWLIPAAALCGVGYITLSGVLLVCGASATANAPAAGVGIVFFMLAVGQVAGAIVFGQLYALLGATWSLLMFAGLALLIMFLTPTRL